MGLAEGAALGLALGAALGLAVGLAVGLALGAALGLSLGAPVAHVPNAAWPAPLAVSHAPCCAFSQMPLAQSSPRQHAWPCAHLLVHSGWPPQSTSVSLFDFVPSTRQAAVVGLLLGAALGLAEGAALGLAEGAALGLAVGLVLGLALGLSDGLAVGLAVGDSVEHRP